MKQKYKFGEKSTHIIKNYKNNSFLNIPIIEKGEKKCDLIREGYGNKFNYIFELSDVISKEGWQDHNTPNNICDMMIDKYEFNQDDNVLFHNISLLLKFYTRYQFEIIEENIYFIADTKDKYDYIHNKFKGIHCIPVPVMKEEVTAKTFIDLIERIEKEMKEKTENKDWHFTTIFSNPPYRKLDLKLAYAILTKELTDKLIMVQPGNFVFNHSKENQKYIGLKALKDVTFFWGNSDEYFNTNIEQVHVITVWERNYNSEIITVHDDAFKDTRNYTYKLSKMKEEERKEEFKNIKEKEYSININDFTIHATNEKDKSIILLKNFINLSDHIKKKTHYYNPLNKKKTDYGVKMPPKRAGNDSDGHMDYSTYFSCFGKDENYFVGKTYENAEWMVWYFDTQDEQINFFNYLRLKTVRFLLSLTKATTRIITGKALESIPWMNFKHAWSEKELCELWGIDKEMWDYINNFIDDYYDDYKTFCGATL